MRGVDITVVVNTLEGWAGSGEPLTLRRQGLSYEDRVVLEWGDSCINVNLSKLRDAVKILGAV